jgi:imidazolonepropionase-like amidohydrolase
MRVSSIIVAAVAATFAAVAHGAQDSQPVVLRAAYLFDSKSGQLTQGGSIVIQGDKISAIGGTPPADARVIDLGDATLLPGFIDAHTHLDNQFEKNFYKAFYEGMLRFPVEQAHTAAAYAKRTLEAGFTTVRNVGAPDFIDIGLRNAINNGVIPGPRMITAAHSIGSTAGHCDNSPFPPDVVKPSGVIDGVCNGADECRAAVRYQLKWGADVIKICASGGVLSESDPVDVPQLTPAELEAIMSETHAWKRKVAAHAHGDLAAKLAIDAGVDSIEHASFLSEATLRLMKQKGVYLVPTRMALYWVEREAATYPPAIAAKARAAAAAHGSMFRMAIKIGVPIALGTDAGVFPHGMNGKEFALMVEQGMAPETALLAGTREAARLLGVDAEVGTLEPGKMADVVAVRGNVLKNIAATEQPVFVMKHGAVVAQKN